MTVNETINRPIGSLDVMNFLRLRYAPPSYILLSEVRNGTGYVRSARSMDAMAFGLWPSRGLEIIGFEIKVSRSDWLRELKNPAKADEFWKYLDRWYVAAPEGIVQKAELPIGWGLLEVRTGWHEIDKVKNLRVTVEATPKKAKVMDRLFLMSIVRNLFDGYVPESRVKELASQMMDCRINEAVESAKWDGKRAVEELAELRKTVATFEVASGIKIGDRWSYPKEMGEAVKLVREHGTEKIRQEMTYTMNTLKSIVTSIEKGLNGNK